MSHVSRAVNNLWIASCKAMMPKPKPPTPQQLTEYKQIIKRMDLCVYCGDAATSMDHFRAIMRFKGRPSGFCDDMWNMVPSCVTCNSSKGNRPWLTFMNRTTGKSPLARGVDPRQHRRRLKTLQHFEIAGRKYVQRWSVQKFGAALDALRLYMIDVTTKHTHRVMKLRNRVVSSMKKK